MHYKISWKCGCAVRYEIALNEQFQPYWKIHDEVFCHTWWIDPCQRRSPARIAELRQAYERSRSVTDGSLLDGYLID